jgi:pyruvate ferredoxin oxidoreductase alpha subunit
VFAPGNVRECYEQTRRAFEIAYDYQIPTIVLYDQKIGGETRNVDESFFDREPAPDLGSTLTETELQEAAHDNSGKFQRFQFETDDGVSPRSVPGQEDGRYLASGNEHNQAGHITEDPQQRVLQVDRRTQKVESIREELADDEVFNTYYGPEDAEYGIITWGSQQGTVTEALQRLDDAGHSVKALSVGQMMPYPRDEVAAFLESVEGALVVEMNASAQFRGLTQKELGRFGEKLSSLLKYNGNPFEPAEIVEGFESSIEGDGEVPGETTRYVPAAGD